MATDKHQGIEKSTQNNGCLSNLTMVPWEYKAFVPKDKWVAPAPTITRVIPGHDARLQSTVAFGEQESVPIQIRFSREMDCDSVANSLEIHSTTQDGRVAQLNRSSIICQTTDADPPRYVGEIATIWIFHAQLEDVSNGVHTYTVKNATTEVGESYTNVSQQARLFITGS
jgi:alpha-1,3-glucan synthase